MTQDSVLKRLLLVGVPEIVQSAILRVAVNEGDVLSRNLTLHPDIPHKVLYRNWTALLPVSIKGNLQAVFLPFADAVMWVYDVWFASPSSWGVVPAHPSPTPNFSKVGNLIHVAIAGDGSPEISHGLTPEEHKSGSGHPSNAPYPRKVSSTCKSNHKHSWQDPLASSFCTQDDRPECRIRVSRKIYN